MDASVYVYMYACVRACVYVHVNVSMHVWTHCGRMNVYINVCIHGICVYTWNVCMYIPQGHELFVAHTTHTHTLTHTYTHTHVHAFCMHKKAHLGLGIRTTSECAKRVSLQ